MLRVHQIRPEWLKTGFFYVALCAAIALLTGCTPRPEPPPVPVTAPAEFDKASRIYQDAARRGETVYRLDGGESMVRIIVYRDGALARLGHDHAVTGRQIQGYAWLPDTGSARADLYLAIAALVVDDPEARKVAGLNTEPTAADIDGTYRNMLASLDAVHYPYIRLHVDIPAAEWSESDDVRITTVDLTLHGMTRQLAIPVSVVKSGNGFHVTGTFRILQTDFGIEPFSVLGGALAVRDELNLSFDLDFGEF